MQFFLLIYGFFNYAQAGVVDLVLADSLIKQNNCNEAATHYSRYLDSVYNPFIESNLAVALFCSGKKEDAFKKANNAYTQNNKDSAIKYNLAVLHTANNDYSLSSDLLNSIDPSSLPVTAKHFYYSLQCWNYFNMDKVEQALDYCSLAENEMPTNPSCNVQYRFGRVLFELGNFKKANSLFEDVHKRCASNTTAYYYSLTLYRMGDKRTAYNILSSYMNNTSNKDLHDLIKGELDK